MKRFAALALVLLAPLTFPAQATDVVIHWLAPTANTDGSVPASFEGFNLYRSATLPVVTGSTTLAGKAPNALSATTLSYIDKAVAPGTYYYGVTAWHCEPAGCTESAPMVSGAVVVKITPKTAAAPTSITVTINGVTLP